MLQLNFIRQHKDKVVEGLKKRNWQEEELLILDELIQLDDVRKKTQTELDEMLAERNLLSKEVGDLMKTGEREKAEVIKEKVAEVKAVSSIKEKELEDVEQKLQEILYKIPNIPHESVPNGKSPEDNLIHRPWPNLIPKLGEEAIPHWELAKRYQLFDMELGTKVTGAGFPIFRNKGAKLER